MQKKASENIASRALATYDRVLGNIPKSEGRCFLLSSQAYESSLAIQGSNSLYTKHLVEGLRGTKPTTDEKGRKIPSSVDENGNVTPETLHNYVYHKVANEAQQVPKIKFEKASNIVIAEHPHLKSNREQPGLSAHFTAVVTKNLSIPTGASIPGNPSDEPVTLTVKKGL